MAYNNYGGNSLYTGQPAGRAYKVSYNRPFNTRAVDGGQDWLFNAEYPMVRWLESNGYDVSYSTGVDGDRKRRADPQSQGIHVSGSRRILLSRGTDQRPKRRGMPESHLAFFSGNEIFWKTRWENSTDGSNTAYRTLVTYKETHANAAIDPLDVPTAAAPITTATWLDPRFGPGGSISPNADGGRPGNSLAGTMYT
jgi:hypothetical protein